MSTEPTIFSKIYYTHDKINQQNNSYHWRDWWFRPGVYETIVQQGKSANSCRYREREIAEFRGKISLDNGTGQIIGTIACDLSTADGASQLFDRAQVLDSPIDVLINNAGIGLLGRHDEVPQEAWERLMEINLMAPMRLCALFSPQMIQRESGHIINVASLAAWSSDVGLSAYSASKFGLRGFSESLVNELGKHGV